MITPLKCSKGHWFQPNDSGPPVCPRCEADARRPKPLPISDDDVLAILSDPTSVDVGQTPDAGSSSRHLKCSLKRHKKVCPSCHCETSFSFEYCPRCGGLLEVAVIEVS
jgi:predicted amidophosphoribosyltransferase